MRKEAIRVEKVYSIIDLQKLLSPVFATYSVKKATLFGSYAKGVATEKAISICSWTAVCAASPSSACSKASPMRCVFQSISSTFLRSLRTPLWIRKSIGQEWRSMKNKDRQVLDRVHYEQRQPHLALLLLSHFTVCRNLQWIVLITLYILEWVFIFFEVQLVHHDIFCFLIYYCTTFLFTPKVLI